MTIIRSLVNAEIVLEDGTKRIIESGHNYEASKIELNPLNNLISIYFKDGVANDIDASAIETINTPVIIVSAQPDTPEIHTDEVSEY